MSAPIEISDFDSIADFKVLKRSDSPLSNEEALECLGKCTRPQKTSEVTFFDSEDDDFFPSCDPTTEEPFDPPMTYETLMQTLHAQVEKSGEKRTESFRVFTHEGKYRPIYAILSARDSDVLDDNHVVLVTGEAES